MATVSLSLKSNVGGATKGLQDVAAATKRVDERLGELSGAILGADSKLKKQLDSLKANSVALNAMGASTKLAGKQKTELQKILVTLGKNAEKNKDIIDALGGEYRQLESATAKVSEKTKGFGLNFGKIAGIVAGATAAFYGLRGAMSGVSATIQAASDLQETQNKFDVVFRNVKGAADEASESIARNYGLSQKASKQFLSDTGDLLAGFGFTQEAALELSSQVAMLGVDLASFTNYSGGAEGAVAALTKGLLGERESLKSLGIAITEADIKALAEESGISAKEIDRVTKANLTLELAMRQSKNAIGDFSRSYDSLANQQRVTKATTEDLAARIGQLAIPVVGALEKIKQTIMQVFGDFLQKNQAKLVAFFEGVAEGLNNLDYQTIKTGLTTVAIGIVGLSASLVAAKVAAIGLKSALVSTGVGAIVVGIASLIAYLVHLYNTSDKARLIMLIAWESIKIAALAAIGGIINAIKLLTAPLQLLFAGIQKVAQAVKPNGALAKMDSPFKALDTAIAGVAGQIDKGAGKIGDYVKDLKGLKDGAKQAAEAQADLNKSVKSAAAGLVIPQGGGATTGGGTVSGETTPSASGKSSQYAKQNYLIKIGADTEEAQGALASLMQNISRIGGTIKAVVDQTLGGLSTMLNGVADGFANITAAVIGEFNSLKEQVGAIAVAVGGMVNQMVQGIGQMLTANIDDKIAQEKRALTIKQKSLEKERDAESENIDALAEQGVISSDEAAKRKKAIDKKYNEEKQKAEQESALKQYELEKQAFEIEKGFKLASIATASALGIVSAWTQLAPIPVVGIGLASALTAVIGALAATQIGVISAQQPPPPPVFATGTTGFTVPQGYERDNFMIGARSGERVQIDNALEAEQGQMMQVQIYLDGRVIGETVQRMAADGRIVLRVAGAR